MDIDLNALIKGLKEAREHLVEAPSVDDGPVSDVNVAITLIEGMIATIKDALPEREYRVRWEIDVTASSPREACKDVWLNRFKRNWPPLPDDACVFDVAVVNPRSHHPQDWERVDLAEED